MCTGSFIKMSLEESLNELITELKVSSQLHAYDEIIQLYHCYNCGTLAEKIRSLEALADWCHPKALGDLKVSHYSNDEWFTLLSSVNSKCKKKRKHLQLI
jgi:hypothetical protein